MPSTVLSLKESFVRDGYVVVPGVFTSEEVAAAKAEVRRILEEVAGGKDELGINTNRHGVYVGLAIRSGLFRRLHADPRIVDPLAECVGPDLEFWSDKIVFKSAQVDYGSPWHQDWSYWNGAHKFSAWIALDDATPANGCLRILPGSHRQAITHGPKPADDRPFVNRLRPEDVDERQAVDVPAAAGTAVIFHDLTAHASYPNQSGRERWALISTYRDASQDDYDYPFAKAAFLVRGTWTGKNLGAPPA